MNEIETVPAPAARDQLEELQIATQMRQAALDAMEREAAELSEHLTQSSALASALKIRVSENDQSASTQLDTLEKRQHDIERRRDGLGARIAQARAELSPMYRAATDLAMDRDRARQDQIVAQIEREQARLLQAIVDHWSRACADAFALMELLEASGQVLDQEHRTRLLSLRSEVGARLQEAAMVPVNRAHEYEVSHWPPFSELRVAPRRRK